MQGVKSLVESKLDLFRYFTPRIQLTNRRGNYPVERRRLAHARPENPPPGREGRGKKITSIISVSHLLAYMKTISKELQKVKRIKEKVGIN